MLQHIMATLLLAQRRTCRCGASTLGDPSGYCPKCLGRIAWRRHHRGRVARRRRTLRRPVHPIKQLRARLVSAATGDRRDSQLPQPTSDRSQG